MADDGLSAGAVARRLGVAVTTLRSWHQRYGLGPNRHVPGQHRRYTTEDLAQLEVMCQLTAEGVTPAEAARWARRGPRVPGTRPAAAPDKGSSSTCSSATPGGVAEGHTRTETGRGGGGAAIPVGRAGAAARGLARAAVRLDAVAMRASITTAIDSDGVVATWEALLRPVLVGVGDRYAASARFIEVEHLLSRCVSEVLARVHRPPGARTPPRILLACADEEQHSLPLEALAAALAEAGLHCRLLGARVPVAALVEAVDRTAPEAVVVWSHARDTADPAQLTRLLSGPRRPVLLLAAGPGWAVGTLPAGVLAPATLAEAVEVLRDVPGSSGR